MFFFFTCGTHTFTRPFKPLAHLTTTCQNCGNHSARVQKRWQWFTFCFVPVIPFSLKPYTEVGCPVCNFWQDVKYRPDVGALIESGGGSGSGGGGGGGPGGAGAGAGYGNGQGGGGAMMMGGMNGGQGYGAPPQGAVPQYK